MFNKLFCSVAPNIQSNINLAYKSFEKPMESIFNKPCTNKEIIGIISDLSSNKATGPNSIPIKNYEISKDCIANNVCTF